MSKKTNSTLFFLAGALTGAAAGVAFGMLFSPEKGTEIRDRLSFQLDKYRSKLREVADDMIAGRGEIPSAAKSEGERVIRDAKSKAEKLLSDVDSLINQINKSKEI
jgi:gas vesicle protein